MNPSHLGKDIITDDGLIGGNGDTTIALHQTGDVVELALVDIGLRMELILQDHLHTRERRITTTLAKTIDGDVESFRTTERCCQRIADGQVVVVVGVEVEVGIGIALEHLAEVLDTLQGIHDAQRIGQHKTTDADVAKHIHRLIYILRRVLHTIRPVLEVEVHDQPLATGVFHLTTDILHMLLGRLAQLFPTMPE